MADFNFKYSFPPAGEPLKPRRVFSDSDHRVIFDVPFTEVKQMLADISLRLAELMPDPSLGPEERLERLARVVPDSVLVTSRRRNARTKLEELTQRLNELVPSKMGRPLEQIEYLVDKLNQLVPEDAPTFRKLEAMGDFRGADIGVSPRLWN